MSRASPVLNFKSQNSLHSSKNFSKSDEAYIVVTSPHVHMPTFHFSFLNHTFSSHLHHTTSCHCLHHLHHILPSLPSSCSTSITGAFIASRHCHRLHRISPSPCHCLHRISLSPLPLSHLAVTTPLPLSHLAVATTFVASRHHHATAFVASRRRHRLRRISPSPLPHWLCAFHKFHQGPKGEGFHGRRSALTDEGKNCYHADCNNLVESNCMYVACM